MFDIHITAFISASRSGETAGAIFPPCSFKTDATHAHPVYRPGRFELPGRFIPSRFVLDLRSCNTAVGSSPAHAQFIASPAGLVLGVLTEVWAESIPAR